MNTLHFKYAVEIERTGSITQAADSLFMSQPNLSKAMKELEETLGITIFRRTSKGVIPTEKGAKFLEYAKNILNQIQAMESLNDPDLGEQVFSISLPYADYIIDGFTQFIAGLKPEHPLDIRCLSGSAMETIGHLTEEKVRLGIIRFPVKVEQYFMDYLHNQNLDFSPLWEFDAVVLTAEEHPWGDKSPLSPQDLEEFTEVTAGQQAVPYLTQRELPIQRAMRQVCCPTGELQLRMLSTLPGAYLWSAPVSADFCRENHLLQHKCTDSRRFKDLLIHSRSIQFTPLELEFIDRMFEARNRVAFVRGKE